MFDKYDQAWAKYQKKLRIVPFPLISWDVFSASNLEASKFNSIQKKWVNKENYHNQIANKSVIVTDKNLTILFTTKEISELTGYRSSEIIGQTPKMFQGVLTDDRTREKSEWQLAKIILLKKSLLITKKMALAINAKSKPIPNLILTTTL